MKLVIVTLCAVACAAADVSHVVGKSDKEAQILAQELNVGPDGTYEWSYETDNGIRTGASGTINNPQSEDAAQVVQGAASWTSPEGEVIQLKYTADEDGYHPQGSHIPTPHPIPEAIIRSLEWNRDHAPKPEI